MGIKRRKKGFTLIETIVVVSVIAIVLPALFSIVFTILKEQAKIYRLAEVKKEGDGVLTKFESAIKSNAVSVHYNGIPPAGRVCDVAGSSSSGLGLYFASRNPGQWFGFYFDGVDRKIVYEVLDNNSADPRLVDMTNSDKVMVSGFNIGCSLTANYTQPTVTMSFNICYINTVSNNSGDSIGGSPCSSASSENLASLHYNTTIRLRNQQFSYPTPTPGGF